jgi:dynein heavy chain
MYIYHNVSLSVEPKRRALAAAQEDLAATTARLQEAQGKLAAVQARIAALEASFEEASAKKEALAQQVGGAGACLARLAPAPRALEVGACMPHQRP